MALLYIIAVLFFFLLKNASDFYTGEVTFAMQEYLL